MSDMTGYCAGVTHVDDPNISTSVEMTFSIVDYIQLPPSPSIFQYGGNEIDVTVSAS